MVYCGWCGHPTEPTDPCAWCGHDPVRPHLQRGHIPPLVETAAGRPTLAESDVRARYEAAAAALRDRGVTPTVEALAEALDRSPRTVRDWRKRFGL